MFTDDDQKVLEGNRDGTRDQAVITKHPDGAGVWDGDCTPSATAGECGFGVST